ncbi:MAG: calcium/sodium antiporter [Gammaproteobacteria bacterium]|nr:calcium/sodium antiporter [Gammaproteobacteria bacterium]
MSILNDGFFLLLGIAALVVGADLLVRGATTLALRWRVSALVIGLTIVSFGTSLPEMLVTLVAGLQGNADLAIANVLGSNIANLLLVLGIAAMVRALPVRESTVLSEIPFSLTAALLVGFLANAALFSEGRALSINRLDGVILLFFFGLFLLYVFKMAKATDTQTPPSEPESSLLRAVAEIGVGIGGLYLGGQWVVESAVALAESLGVGQALIGLTIVAIGTSAPEVAASAMAAYRNQADLAVGNAIGSSIFNLLWVLGLTATFVELPFKVLKNTDLLMVIASSALIILALVTSRHNALGRAHGAVFVLVYAGYLVYVIQRG